MHAAVAALHAAEARSRGGAPVGRGWVGVEDGRKSEKQIPFGNDSKKGKSTGKDKGEDRGNGNW